MERQVWSLSSWEEFIELKGRRAGLLAAFHVIDNLRFGEETENAKHY